MMERLKRSRGASFTVVAVVYALAVIAAAPEAWYLAAGALANTVLFLAVSIPMADRRQSRKEGFSEYKRQTRMLLPIGRRSR